MGLRYNRLFRYWALLTGASGALNGPIAADWVVA